MIHDPWDAKNNIGPLKGKSKRNSLLTVVPLDTGKWLIKYHSGFVLLF